MGDVKEYLVHYADGKVGVFDTYEDARSFARQAGESGYVVRVEVVYNGKESVRRSDIVDC